MASAQDMRMRSAVAGASSVKCPVTPASALHARHDARHDNTYVSAAAHDATLRRMLSVPGGVDGLLNGEEHRCRHEERRLAHGLG